MPSLPQIRRAILAHHGGHQEATDHQLLTIWQALPPDVQERYLRELSDAEFGSRPVPDDGDQPAQ